MPRGSNRIYTEESKCINVGCENKPKGRYKCANCMETNRLFFETEERTQTRRERARARYAANPEPTKKQSAKWQKDNPEKYKKGRIFRDFGLPWEEYLRMRTEQKGKCKVCDKEFLEYGQSSISVAVDHDHRTGLVRGLLHSRCNKGIGHLEENSNYLRNAAAYVEEFNSRPENRNLEINETGSVSCRQLAINYVRQAKEVSLAQLVKWILKHKYTEPFIKDVIENLISDGTITRYSAKSLILTK